MEAIQCLLLSHSMSNNTNNNKQIIEKTSCNLEVNKCDQIIKLNEIMTEYNKNDNDNFEFSDDDIIKILDYFNHFLSFHNRDDISFEAVYKLFGGNCEATKCKKIQRHHRNREEKDDDNQKNANNETNKLVIIEDIFNKIHCHIHHQYDIGYRLTNKQRMELNQWTDDEKTDDNDNMKNNAEIIKSRQTLKEKLLKSQQIKPKKNNKFSSNLNQSVEHNMNGYGNNNDDASISKYSYSFPFIYKHKYKDSKKFSGHGNWTCSDLYIPQNMKP